MRTVVLTAVAALALCTTQVTAQSTGTMPTVQNPQKLAPWQEKQKSLLAELNKTIAEADNLLATANKMAASATGKDKTMLQNTVSGITTVKKEVTAQVAQVRQATEKTANTIFAKASEVNTSSKASLERYRLELNTKPTTPTGTKPVKPTGTTPTVPTPTK